MSRSKKNPLTFSDIRHVTARMLDTLEHLSLIEHDNRVYVNVINWIYAFHMPKWMKDKGLL